MRLFHVEQKDIESIADLIEAGLGLGQNMTEAVAQALITVYGDHDQFRRELPTWKGQRPRVSAGFAP